MEDYRYSKLIFDEKKKIKLNRIIPITIVEILFIVVLIFLLFRVEPKDIDSYFVSSDNVKVVEEDDYYFFDSKSTDRVLIFYPGAKICEKSYAPILRMIAESGTDVYCFHMPFYLAVLRINKADSVLSNSSYKTVIVGGHSLGGSMASYYALNSKYDIKGLVLLGSYSIVDLNGKDNLSVFSSYGTRDEILNMNNYNKYKSNLPNLTEVVIDHGNHSRYASYGDVLENSNDVISKEEQWNITYSNLSAWILTL